MTAHHLLRVTLDEVLALRMECNRCGCAVELKVAGDSLFFPPMQCPGCQMILHDNSDKHPLLRVARCLREMAIQAEAEQNITFQLEFRAGSER